MQTEISLLENGKLIALMGKAYILQIIKKLLKEYGRVGYSFEERFGCKNMKVNGKTIQEMGSAYTLLRIRAFMKEIGKMVISMEKES